MTSFLCTLTQLLFSDFLYHSLCLPNFKSFSCFSLLSSTHPVLSLTVSKKIFFLNLLLFLSCGSSFLILPMYKYYFHAWASIFFILFFLFQPHQFSLFIFSLSISFIFKVSQLLKCIRLFKVNQQSKRLIKCLIKEI